MYIYTVTKEGRDCNREFDVRCYSENIEFALDAMWRDVRDDEYGILKENGIEYMSYNNVTSKFDDCFVSYSVFKVSDAFDYIERRSNEV